MIALLQRTARASVTVDGRVVGEAGRGLCVFVCAVKGDTEEKARQLAQKLVRCRVFEDEAGKMNRSVQDIGGELCRSSRLRPTRAAATVRALRLRPNSSLPNGSSIFSLPNAPQRA